MANIEGTSVLMTSVPRSTTSDGQRDRFGNKKALSWKGGLSGPDRKLCSRMPALPRPTPHNGTQTMKCFEISGPAAFFSFHAQKSTLYTTI